MKNKALCIAILATMTLIQFNACTKDSLGGSGGDNGNAGIEFWMRSHYYGWDQLYFFKEFQYTIHEGGYSYYHCCELTITESNNFYVWNGYDEYYGSNPYGIGQIASVGSASSLSRIKKIPDSGWVHEIAVHPGSGYVIRFEDENGVFHYARVYVEDWIIANDGGIIGALIWYEDKWK